MNIFYKFSLVLFLWLIFSSFSSFEYRNIKTNDPLSIHIIEIDPTKYKIKAVLANEDQISRDTVLNICKKNLAKAGINGGFFKIDGLPAGILKIDNKWISLPTKIRAAFGFDNLNSTFIIDRLDAKATLLVGSYEIPIDGINRPRQNHEKILYLHPFYSTYSKTSNYLYSYMVLSNDFFVASNTDDEIVDLLKYNNFQYRIDVFSMLSPISRNIWQNIDNIVGGTPILIYNREKILDYSSEKTIESFLTKKHARTALGIKENGNLIFVVVDGNNLCHSIGMTMDEIRDFMYDLDCIYALNLDGGSSSTMVIDNTLKNLPEYIFSPEVSDAILILEK